MSPGQVWGVLVLSLFMPVPHPQAPSSGLWGSLWRQVAGLTVREAGPGFASSWLGPWASDADFMGHGTSPCGVGPTRHILPCNLRGKIKSKSKGDTAADLLEWLKSRTLTASKAGEAVEQQGCSFIAGRKADGAAALEEVWRFLTVILSL